MNLEDLRIDCAIKQKRGIHFISASIVIWLLVMMVQFLDLPILTKNLLTFCCTAPLLPLAFLMSKLLKIQFQDKSNPLNNLGILFSINQILYLLIAMWIYPTVPEKMLMVIAMIFGAHLLPYSWLYKSKTYMIMSVLIPIASLIVGCNSTRLILALMMLVFEIIFTALLIIENNSQFIGEIAKPQNGFPPISILGKETLQNQNESGQTLCGIGRLVHPFSGAAVKAGCKPVHFSLDGCPLSRYFSGSVATTSGHFVHKSERRTRDGGFHIRPVC